MIMQIITISILLILSAGGAFVFALVTVGGLQVTRKASSGLLQYFFYFMLFGNAVSIYFTHRDFDAVGLLPMAAESAPGAAGVWAVRLTSLFILFASADQIIRYFSRNPPIEAPRAVLAIALACFWVANLLIPAFFASHPVPFELSWVYPLFLGCALICMPERVADQAVEVCRNAIVLFCSASLILIIFAPNVVLDRAYTQGYIPGLPRFAGLAPHAIMMGMIASVGAWCLMAAPMQSKWLGRLSNAVCLLSLFLAQSKAVWITFILGVPILLYYRRQGTLSLRKNLLQMNVLTGLVMGIVIVGTVGLVSAVLAGKGEDRINNFTRSSEGAQLLSFTGRDVIWDISMREWRASPVFGYGLPVFGEAFRKEIHMSNATSGHNQFYDSLARTGLVGTIGFSVYLVVLFWLGLRYARVSKGLSAVLAISLVLRTISETPISAGIIGSSDLPHYLLLAVIAASVLRHEKAQRRVAVTGALR